MKKCPTCNRTYADETFTYCLADGSLLSAPYDPEATLHLPTYNTNPPATEVLPSAQAIPQTTSKNRNFVSTYIIIGFLALIAGGGLVALLISRAQDISSKSSANTASTPARSQQKPDLTSPSPKSLIIGKWKLLGKSWDETLEFLSDGRYHVNADYGSHTGQWALLNETHLTLTYKGKVTTNQLSFQDEQLILIDIKGEVYKYARMP